MLGTSSYLEWCTLVPPPSLVKTLFYFEEKKKRNKTKQSHWNLIFCIFFLSVGCQIIGNQSMLPTEKKQRNIK